MAKELPYFRFTASEWQNGKISIESYELQGFFMSVCCYYWSNNCEMTKSHLEKRFKHDKELIYELINNEIMKYEPVSDSISILFLDEQFELLSESRKSRQIAGSKGGLNRWNKINNDSNATSDATSNATSQPISQAEDELKQNLSYKDKDKEKDKEKKYIYNAFYDSELSKIDKEKNDGRYQTLVEYLFGKNKTEDKLAGVLSIQKQLSFKQFEIVMEKCDANKVKLGDILTKMENDPKYYKGKKSLYLTLLNWIDSRFVTSK